MNSQQDDHSVPPDEEKQQISRSRRKPLVVKQITQQSPKVPKLGKRKLSDSISKKGSNYKKSSSAVSQVSERGKRRRGNLVSDLIKLFL